MKAYSFRFPGEIRDNPNPPVTERSRYVRGLQCSRARFFEYEAGPARLGFASNKKYDDLLVGSAVHEGMEQAMLAAKVMQDSGITVPFNELAIHGATYAYEYFIAQAKESGAIMGGMPDLDTLLPEVWEELMQEQAYLSGMLVAAAVTSWLPRILDEFIIEETEQEISWTPEVPGDEQIVIMSRPDAVLRNRATGELYVLSYKTTKRFYPSDLQKLQSDIQALTEMAAVYSKTGETPAGCLYLYFLKGDRKKKEREDGSLIPVYSNTLVRPYVSLDLIEGADPDPEHFRLLYERVNPETGKRSRLGAAWQTAPFWNYLSLSQWLDWHLSEVFAEEVGGNALDLLLASPEPVHRPLDQIIEAVNTLSLQESERVTVLQHLENSELGHIIPDMSDPKLKLLFPKNPASCFLYNRPCSWHGICWEQDSLQKRIAAGNINVRVPNHGQETEED